MNNLISIVGDLMVEVMKWLKDNKDAFSALGSISTIAGIVIGGYWAWRRIIWQKPNECGLTLDIDVSAIHLQNSKVLLTVDTTVNNVGTAIFKIDDKIDSRFKSWIKIRGITKSGLLPLANREVDWESVRPIYDGWFRDSPQLVLGSGERERLTGNYVLPRSVSIVNVWVKVYETKIRRGGATQTEQTGSDTTKTEKRPYFWSTNKTFLMKELLAKPDAS